jgi:hypothetical protein
MEMQRAVKVSPDGPKSTSYVDPIIPRRRSKRMSGLHSRHKSGKRRP